VNLMEKIEQQLKDAIRRRDETARNAIRLLLTALKVKEKEVKRLLNEAEIQQAIASQIKQRKDSAEQYGSAGRADLAGLEEDEIRVLQGFLPTALSTEALGQLIDDVIAEMGALTARDFGVVMKAIMPKVAGRADGKLVNELVRRRLSG
jgi:uncharacterized protein